MEQNMMILAFIALFAVCSLAKPKDGHLKPSFCRKKDFKHNNIFANIFNATSYHQGASGNAVEHYGEQETVGNALAVNVTLYYESLCPDCKQVIFHQLEPTYQKLKSSKILNIDLVPFGNARETKIRDNWFFFCQHGPPECLGNLIETCSIRHSPKDSIIPYIFCLEYYGPDRRNGQYCAGLYGIPWNDVSNCVEGLEGNQLQHEMAVKTKALNPPHQYVPWFTMNGVHSDDIQNGLSTYMLSYVCRHYTGVKPRACMA